MKSSIERFYDFVAWFYPLIDLFLKAQKRILIKKVNKLPKGLILEIGAGNCSHLGNYKQHSITAIDISERMLKFARQKKLKNTHLLKMNAEQLTFENKTFDYVIISHVIAVVEKPEKVLEEAYRVLKSNGKLLLLNHFTPDNWLKYIDKAFTKISNWLRLKSEFYPSDLKTLEKFTLEQEESLGFFSYYKLLILIKN
jgi:phosphatidylethanolamine/phosphatidyl-N-methylethanolamine N-methyltransferase